MAFLTSSSSRNDNNACTFQTRHIRASLRAAITEKNKYSCEALCCFSQLQSNFTTWAKTARFHRFVDVQGAKQGGKMNLLADPLLDRLYLKQPWRRWSLHLMPFTGPIFWCRTSPP